MTSRDGKITIRPLDRPGDLGWVVMAHGEIYSAEFGWDRSFEALVARIVLDYAADHDPQREAAWIAEMGARRVGCLLCLAAEEERRGRVAETAQLRVLLVDPSARGRGLGGRLVDLAIDFARNAGYARVVLWTNDPLEAARHVYLTRGFRLTGEDPHHSFGVDLVGQTYELDLRVHDEGSRA
jgi:GNAT superfamily N-acetyltransferase